MRYLYRYCICCETYKKIEVNNRLYKDLKRFGLLHGERGCFRIPEKHPGAIFRYRHW